MSSPISASSELRGTFRGFFRDLFGKRRMVLRVGKEELFLKVPKELREQLEGKIAAGDEIVATGVEDGHKRAHQFVVSGVRLASGSAICAACPIHVCVKKNCWRSGGRELWATLERGLADVGLDEVVKLKAVDCLDHCKHAPNAEWQGHAYRRCGPAEAAAIVSRVAVDLGAASREGSPSSSREEVVLT